MIDNTMKADAAILTELFNGLLEHSVFPPAWKRAKCVPIPKLGQTNLSTLNNLRLISILSCLSKTLEKMLTQRVAWAGKCTGPISPDHLGSRAGLSSVDALMMMLTRPQEWLLECSKSSKSLKGPVPTRPSVLTNDIAGAFNCVVHELAMCEDPYFEKGNANNNLRRRFPTFQGSTLSPSLKNLHFLTLSFV